MDNQELGRFKSDINLSEFAASRGYELVKRELSASGKWRGSTKASILMRHSATDDKIIVSRGGDGHWTYFSVRDDSDNGTIVDFLQKRQRLTLGGVRIELRKWLGVDRPLVVPTLFAPVVEPQVRDLVFVSDVFERAEALKNSLYLNSRGIRPETLSSPRFAGTFRVNLRGNVLFPHYDFADPPSLAGYEEKNRDFTSFAKGGYKTLWMSHAQLGDQVLVFTETAIDALSYHQVNRPPHACYASTAGGFSSATRDLIVRAIAEMPPGSSVVAATDDDISGDKLAAQIEAAAGSVPVRRHIPPGAKDWNDCLQVQEREYIRSIESRRGPRLER